ncbi:hypothetical protein MNBD_GAMMA02-23, partial [hydrothermal vent metagenome]
MKFKLQFFLAITIFLSQIFIFFPIITWTQNQFNIDTPFIEGLALLLFVFFIVLLVAGLLAWIIPSALRKILLPLFVLLTVLVFVQQNILVYDYGLLDGRDIQFDDAGMVGLIDFALWGLGLFIWLFLSKLILKQATLILTFSGLASVAVSISSLLFYDFASNHYTLTITENQKFDYSKEKNVLIFLLDTFQTDLFLQIIDAEPEIKDELLGFNFYPNTTAVFNKTYPTIPLLLTGKTYQKKQGIHEFLVAAYQSSLLTDLIDAGWHVGLYPNINKLIPVNSNIMSNAINKNGWQEKIKHYLQTLDLSLLRSVPHVIKPTIFNQGKLLIQKPVVQFIEQQKWFVDQSLMIQKMPNVHGHLGLNFLANLKQYASASQKQPTFMFYHLLMPHRPFLLDRNLAPVNNKHDFKAYQGYAYASLKLMISYLSELKKLGIYDQSAIMIVSDHGAGDYTNLEFDESSKSFIPIQRYGHEIASAKPLLLVKGFHEKNTFSISQKPVSLLDVMPTLADFSDIPIKASGLPIHMIDEKQTRERFYYHYDFTGFDSKYLQDFNVFKISGPVNDEHSWQHQGLLTVTRDAEAVNDGPYYLNEIIRFGTDLKQDADHSNRFIISDNPHFNLSSLALNNQKTELEIPMAEPMVEGELYQLELWMSSAEGDNELNINIENQRSTVVNVDEKSFIYQFPFVFHGSDNKQLNLKIEDIRTHSNSSVAMSKLFIKKINVRGLKSDDEDLALDFAKDIDDFHAYGFRPVEKWGGRWTTKKQSSVLFMASKNFCLNKSLKLNLLKFQMGVDSTQFKVF